MKANTSSIIGIQLFAVMFFGLLLASTTASADDSVVDDVNITVPVSCSMSGTGMDSHNANISNGTYQPNIGTTTIHAFCNDNEGFAIYTAGYTGNEIGATNSNKLVGTSASGNSTIDTGLATTTGTPDVSNWAMKLAITQDSGDTTGTNAFTIDSDTEGPFSTYHTVPNAYTKVAHKTAATNMTASTGGVKLTTTYAAYISKNQPADTYTGQVIYTLVHPSSAPAPLVCNPSGTTIGTNTSTDITCMQDISSTNKSSILTSMTTGTQYILADKRDNKTYTISKLADGNIWMTKNLDLDIDSTRTYTNEDTDLGYNTTTGQYDTASWTPIRSTYQATSNHIHEWCVGGTWNSQYGYCELNNTPESYDPGNLYWNLTENAGNDWGTYRDGCDLTTSTPSCNQNLNPISTYTASSGTTQYHLGNYYNWAAALATNDSSVYNDDDLVEQSICPAGWTLPRIGQGEDTFYVLWNQYGFANASFNDTDNDEVHDAGEDALWTSPLYFSASGGFGGALYDVAADGYYWSPVANGSYGARGAGFVVDGGAGPSGGSNRGGGSSVRCVARPVASSVSEGGGGGGGP